ncbi:hypothetical protein QTP88_002689 [Uroleucon formosanum]
MAKRITEFCSSVPIKSRKIDEQLKQEVLPKVSNICCDLSSNNSEDSRNGRDPKKLESTSDQTESYGKITDTIAEPTETKKSEWYKGSKLDISWILQTYSFFQKIKLGKRYGIKCMTCFTHIQEAKKFSKNGTIPIADGVRCDSQNKLERIIDHLTTEAHNAATNLDQMQIKWMEQSDEHPWIKTLKSHEAEKVKLLIELAIDVYNDSRQLTLSAHSWPSRSLSKMHADSQIASYKEEGLTSQFVQFNPTAALLQYRNPVIYQEMLDTVGRSVMEKVVDQLKKIDCFSIQVDGSVDKYGVDNKFITARYLTENLEIKSVFLGESKSDIRGAEGLLDSIKIVFQDLDIEDTAKEKLTGVTTDGENANTESTITEVRHWKTNLKAVATFYRGSTLRYGWLEKIGETKKISIYRFPAYFEVRFAEYLLNLSKALWKNLPCMQIHWQSIIESSDSTKIEKATAKGFLRTWKNDGEQQHLTCLMMDILRHIEKLQKDSQKSKIIMTDIELSKKVAVDSIALMENEPYPGGNEEKLMNCLAGENIEETNTDIVEEVLRERRNYFVSTKRCWSAVRKEIVLSCKEFLSQRLAVDQENIIERMNKFIDARSSTDTIQAGRTDVLNLFGEHAVSCFTDDVISLYAADKLPPPLEMNNSTAKMYHFLKVSTQSSIFSKLVQSFISLTPHSAGPERAVSLHTTLKTSKQSSYSREAINSRMYIALNGIGTALFDPRPAVAKFLESKERRRKLPDPDLYKNQEFIQKFFSIDSNL